MIKLSKLYFCLHLLIFIFAIGFSQVDAQWEKQANGLPHSPWSYSSSIDACDSLTAIVSTGNEIYQTMDKGKTWHNLSLPNDLAVIYDIALIDSLHIWICDGEGNIFATADRGLNWVLQFHDETKTKFMNYIEMFNLNDGVAMGDYFDYNIPEGPAIFLNTSDGGKTWISVNNSKIGYASADTWRRLDFISPSIGYFQPMGLNPQKIYKSTNGGQNWIPTNYPAGEWVQVLKFYNENIGVVVSRIGLIYRTFDGGQTWQQINTPHIGWGEDIEFSPDNPAKIWMGDGLSIFFSNDTGKTWMEQRADCKPYDIVFADSMNGWFVGIEGVYLTDTGGITRVPIDKFQQPVDFLLFQNYPNPFNAATEICYQLPEATHVKIEIHNLLGQKIRTLIDGQKPAGSHTVRWDGRDDSGAAVSSGVYLYRLTAGRFCETRKMVLMR